MLFLKCFLDLFDNVARMVATGVAAVQPPKLAAQRVPVRRTLLTLLLAVAVISGLTVQAMPLGAHLNTHAGQAVVSPWHTPDLPYLFAPVKNATMSSKFGYRTDPMNGRKRLHSGMDIAAPSGSDIVVPQAGVVVFAGKKGGYGNVVVVQHHPFFHTLYAHASKIVVKRGQTVQSGQTIAHVGTTGRSTGPHLHFETIVNQKYTDPADYLAFLNQHPPVHPAQYIAGVQGKPIPSQVPQQVAAPNIASSVAPAAITRPVTRQNTRKPAVSNGLSAPVPSMGGPETPPKRVVMKVRPAKKAAPPVPFS